mgnify:FL=1
MKKDFKYLPSQPVVLLKDTFLSWIGSKLPKKYHKEFVDRINNPKKYWKDGAYVTDSLFLGNALKKH